MAHVLSHLPFARERDDHTVDLWAISPTGVVEEDEARGAEYADALTAEIVETGFPPLLGHVVKSIMDRGEFGSTEIAFFHRLATRLL